VRGRWPPKVRARDEKGKGERVAEASKLSRWDEGFEALRARLVNFDDTDCEETLDLCVDSMPDEPDCLTTLPFSVIPCSLGPCSGVPMFPCVRRGPWSRGPCSQLRRSCSLVRVSVSLVFRVPVVRVPVATAIVRAAIEAAAHSINR
jgi:hypothetical protein